MMASFKRLLGRLEQLIDRLEVWLPPHTKEPDWTFPAFYWRKYQGVGYLEAVQSIAPIAFDDLQQIDEQKKIIVHNTQHFLNNRPANHVLLTGSRGTGKSSLIKACLQAFFSSGLRLIEVSKDHLVDLPDIVKLVAKREEKFILFCDDLSFETGELGYKALKVALDGSIYSPSSNVLIYATSNRRHLMPQYPTDNQGYKHSAEGELHPSEVIEEKISLSERFGLWISFYPFSQAAYWEIVRYWLKQLSCTEAEINAAYPEALQFALQRASRSGRVAYQFACFYVGSLHDLH